MMILGATGCKVGFAVVFHGRTIGGGTVSL